MIKNKNHIIKKVQLWGLLLSVFFLNANVVYAADVGKKAGEWVLNQIFWVVVVVTVVALVGCVMKRSVTAAITTVVIGSIVAYFCKNPKAIEDLGNAIGKVIM